jgi:hypothetical protein
VPESLRQPATEKHRTIADELRFRLKILLYATILIYAVVIAAGFIGWYINHQQASKTERALCSLKAELQRRVDNTQAFLVKYPHGLDGLSKADLTKSIQDTQRTIDALSILNCPIF